MDLAGRADRFKFLIRVRGDRFTKTFDEVFAVNGVRIIKSPVRSPRANSFAERYAGTLRRECLDHLLIHGERHLREILIEYAQHYDEHRPHQARGQRAPLYEPGEAIDVTARIKRRKAVQGLISEYRRAVEQSCKTPGQKQGTSFGTAQGGRRVARCRAKPVGARVAGGRRDSTEVETCQRPAGWSPATARPALPSCWPLPVRAGQHTYAPGAG
jgi:hypothetical protein